MSTAPSGWQAPKVNWTPEPGVGPADFNRIEGNANAIETGQRILDQALASPANTGTLRQILSWIVGRIRAITGAANWFDAPATTLAAAKAHADAAAPHSGHETPAGAQAKVDAHANATSVHGATSAATANRMIIRDASGRAKVTAPSAADDIARKDTVDGLKGAVNTWTQRQTFATGIQDGDNNADVSYLYALGLQLDTRGWHATAWDAKGRPTTVEIRSGTAVIATATITYNAKGLPTQLMAVVATPDGNRTITWSQSFEGDTKFLNRTKVVS